MVVNKAQRGGPNKTATLQNGDQAKYLKKEATTTTTTTCGSSPASSVSSKTSFKKTGRVLFAALVCASSIFASFSKLRQNYYPISDQRHLLVLDSPVFTTGTEKDSFSFRVNEYNDTKGEGGNNRAVRSPQRDSSNAMATNKKVNKDKKFMHSMRACIMVRNDNHLLAEWIAYHYTVLPLRYLIIASDDNATDDPYDVLKHWEGTDLNYEIWHSDNYTQNLTYDDWRPLNRFRKRQPYFMGKCMEHFHKQGNLGWVAMIDTDEYIKLNPLDDYLNDKLYVQNKKPSDLGRYIAKDTGRYLAVNETLQDRIAMRKKIRQRLGLEKSNKKTRDQLPTQTKIPTVLDVLDEYTAEHDTLPCHSFSRLRYSAVMDNLTDLSETLCTPTLDPNIASSMNAFTRLSTIRFLYHAAPLKFTHNEWAKALIDLRRIPYESLSNVFNPHRPLAIECQGTYIHDMASFIHANHYANELKKFTRKGDTRRQQTTVWETVGHLREGVRCDQIHGWLNEFVQQFGVVKAKQMLAL